MKMHMGKKPLLGLAAILVTTAALVCLPMSGYHKPVQKQQHIKIGVSAYKSNDTFVSSILAQMEQMSKEYEKVTGVKVTLDITGANENQRTQNDQVKRYISLGYDVICVNIVDRTIAAPMIDDAVEAGVPLIFFNREPVEEDLMRGENVYYVGSDAKETAVLQSKITADLWKSDRSVIDRNDNGKIEYVMLEGEMGHQDALIRTEWSIRSLTQNGIPTEKLQSGIANWDRNQAAVLMEQWLSSYGDTIELVICNNDDMALGAADAVEKSGLSGIKIVGIDSTPQGLDAVQNGKLLGTVDCSPQLHADYIFRLACGLAIDGNVPTDMPVERERYMRVRLKTITKNDLSE